MTWPVGEVRTFERVKVRNSDSEEPGPRYGYAEPTAECGACGLALTEAETAEHVCPGQ